MIDRDPEKWHISPYRIKAVIRGCHVLGVALPGPLGAGNTHHSRQWAAVIVGAPPCRTRGRLPADRLLLPAAAELRPLLFQPGCFLRWAPSRTSTSDAFIMSAASFRRSGASGFRAGEWNETEPIPSDGRPGQTKPVGPVASWKTLESGPGWNLVMKW